MPSLGPLSQRHTRIPPQSGQMAWALDPLETHDAKALYMAPSGRRSTCGMGRVTTIIRATNHTRARPHRSPACHRNGGTRASLSSTRAASSAARAAAMVLWSCPVLSSARAPSRSARYCRRCRNVRDRAWIDFAAASAVAGREFGRRCCDAAAESRNDVWTQVFIAIVLLRFS